MSTKQQVAIGNDIVTMLEAYLQAQVYDKLFILTDQHTHAHCFPVIQAIQDVKQARLIIIRAGDVHKNVEQLMVVWKVLSEHGASRNSLLINLGGGMITDLGGFAGATFKRGLHTLNIPTTLMAAVDAAVGGKTGVNFNGLKNEIGSFYVPDSVLIDCVFLRTLDQDNLLSGYAEMIKHGLVDSPAVLGEVLSYPLDSADLDIERLTELVKISVAIKERIVSEDPTEKGIRKALNLGHTVGHAFESLSFKKERPILHGHAVAAGLVCELYLSHKNCQLPVGVLRSTTNFIKENYPSFGFGCDDYNILYELMTHDKKNESEMINFTLLAEIGDIRINQIVAKKMIFEALDFYRETCL